jgi:F0F1-type ATP synthase membrane subunit b/b'
LHREIKEKRDEISSLKKDYELMEEKYKQTIDQLNSGVK